MQDKSPAPSADHLRHLLRTIVARRQPGRELDVGNAVEVAADEQRAGRRPALG